MYSDSVQEMLHHASCTAGFEEARKGFCACMMYMKTRSSDVRKDIKGKHTTVLVFSDENVNDV